MNRDLEPRIAALRDSKDVYGLDYAETRELVSFRKWRLTLHFFEKFNPLLPSVPTGLAPGNFIVEPTGLQRMEATTPKVTSVEYPEGLEEPPCVTTLDAVIEFAEDVDELAGAVTFQLKLVNDPRIDGFFSEAPFKIGDVTDVDPLKSETGPFDGVDEAHAAIDYMAKDYDSFRRMMLDRFSLDLPQWKERDPADIGVMLVEVLAYAGDYLSYYQDAVATEAYLETARERLSAVRHAQLLDYDVDQGCNSRVWACIKVAGVVELPARTPLLTGLLNETGPLARGLGQTGRVAPDYFENQVKLANYETKVFETMYSVTLDPKLETLSFYCWGLDVFTLEAGSTSVALEGALLAMPKGTVLIFEQGTKAHAVRLVSDSRRGVDSLLARQITYIEWSNEDAPLVAFEAGPGVEGGEAQVLGNVVLADSGATIYDEALPQVPYERGYYPELLYAQVVSADSYRHSEALDRPAAWATEQNPRSALPQVRLEQDPSLPVATDDDALGPIWIARRELSASGRFDRDFVVESVASDDVRLRFGNGVEGKRPDPGASFRASYRVDFSQAGDPGPNTIAYVATYDDNVVGVRNPIAASGFSSPETTLKIRLNAPQAHKVQGRCVTGGDWVEAALKAPGVSRAHAVSRWTGSRNDWFVYVDRAHGQLIDDEFISAVFNVLSPMRPMGVGLTVVRWWQNPDPDDDGLCATTTSAGAS